MTRTDKPMTDKADTFSAELAAKAALPDQSRPSHEPGEGEGVIIRVLSPECVEFQKQARRHANFLIEKKSD